MNLNEGQTNQQAQNEHEQEWTKAQRRPNKYDQVAEVGTNECMNECEHGDELPLALDTYSDTRDLWPNLSEHFPSVSDPH